MPIMDQKTFDGRAMPGPAGKASPSRNRGGYFLGGREGRKGGEGDGKGGIRPRLVWKADRTFVVSPAVSLGGGVRRGVGDLVPRPVIISQPHSGPHTLTTE